MSCAVAAFPRDKNACPLDRKAVFGVCQRTPSGFNFVGGLLDLNINQEKL